MRTAARWALAAVVAAGTLVTAGCGEPATGPATGGGGSAAPMSPGAPSGGSPSPAASSPGVPSPGAAASSAPEAAGPRPSAGAQISVTVAGDEVRVTSAAAPGAAPVEGSRVKVRRGTTVRISVTSDSADEFHLHGYDRTLRLRPGMAGVLQLVADIRGVFEAELHHSGARAFELQVS